MTDVTFPTSWDAAIAEIGTLVRDPNLVTGLTTVGIVLLVSGVATWALLRIGARR